LRISRFEPAKRRNPASRRLERRAQYRMRRRMSFAAGDARANVTIAAVNTPTRCQRPRTSGEKPQGRADGIVPGSRPHTDRPRSHRNVAAVSCGDWQAPDSAASPGNAEGTKAPGEAPVLACPRHRKRDSRASIKRADDPWVIAYRGVRWTVTHEKCRMRLQAIAQGSSSRRRLRSL